MKNIIRNDIPNALGRNVKFDDIGVRLTNIFRYNSISCLAKILRIRFLKKNGTYVDKYTVGLLSSKFEGFILIYEAMIAKNEFNLPLAVT